MTQIKGKQIASGSINSDRLVLSDSFAFSGSVTVGTPSGSTQVANKSYVDSVVTGGQAGLDFKESARLASTQSINDENATTAFSYSAGVLSEDSAAASTILIDSTALVLGNRVLLKNESTASNNGLYEVTQVGNGSSTTWELTRAGDADTSADLTAGAFLFIEAGASNANRSFVLQTVQSGANAGQSPTLDTDDLSFIQFSGAGQITAGEGIGKDGDTLNLDINGLSNSLIYSSVSAADDNVVVYDADTSEHKKLAVRELVRAGVDTSGGLDNTNANGLRVKVKSQGGLGIDTNGLDLYFGNLPAKTAGQLDAFHYFILGYGGDPKRMSTSEVLSQLAGNGISANTTNFTLDASVSTQDTASISGSALTADESATGLTISATPHENSHVQVLVNGVGINLGNGAKSGDGYFSGDSNTSARSIADIASGDEFYWNGSSAYELDSNDIVEFIYNA